MARKDEIVRIAYEVDLDDVVKAAAKKKGLSEKETKELLKQLRIRETKAMRQQARITAKEQRESSKRRSAIRAATKSKIESFKKFGDAAQGSIGSITTRVFNLGEGLVQFASAAGPVGLVGLALGALATGGVVAIGAVTAAMVGLVLKADDLNKEISKFNDLGGFKDAVSSEQMKMIAEFNQQIKATSIVFKQIAVLLASEFAPHLRTAGELLLRLTLAGRDGLIGLAESTDLVVEGVVKLVKGFGILLTGPVGALKLLADMTVAVFDALGKTNPAIESLRSGLKSIDATVDGLIRSGVESTFDLIGIAAGKASTNLSKYDEEIRNFFKQISNEKNKSNIEEAQKQLEALRVRLGQVGASTSGLIKTFDNFQNKALLGIANPVQKVQIELANTLAQFEDSRKELEKQRSKLEQSISIASSRGIDTALLEKNLSAVESRLSQFEASRVQLIEGAAERVKDIRAKEQSEHEMSVQATQQIILSAGKHIGAFASQLADNAKEGTDAQKKAARAAFAINQALAISSITMSTAQAIMQALGSMPPPMSFVAAGAAGVAGAAQLATVVATPPPSFHIGGGIGTSTTAPDEVMVKAKSGEGVLTGAGMRAIGGRQGLADANRGGSGSREMVVVQKYQHRPLAVVMEDSVRMTNSPIRRAIKGKKKVGHRG